jgi:ABC-type glycerol-3-phosphate transport system permease component
LDATARTARTPYRRNDSRLELYNTLTAIVLPLVAFATPLTAIVLVDYCATSRASCRSAAP